MHALLTNIMTGILKYHRIVLLFSLFQLWHPNYYWDKNYTNNKNNNKKHEAHFFRTIQQESIIKFGNAIALGWTGS